MKRATYFPLALIAAAILASMAATYKLMDWTQNQQRELVVRQQSATRNSIPAHEPY